MCTLHRDGTLHVHIGAVDLTGTSTTFALLAAEAFGIAPERVRVVVRDTDTSPYAGAAGGSKTTYTVGPAVIEAAREARRQVLAIAAAELEAAEEDLEIMEGEVRVRGVPGKGIPLAAIARKTMQFGGAYPPILGRGRHVDTTQSPGFCAQLAEVDVEKETGQVRVRRLVIVQDVGKALNPPAVRGQMIGGAMQGLGWALHERLVYDASGQLLTATWSDYHIPTAEDLPDTVEAIIVEVPSDHGPMGARGVGEPPVVPTAAAVANAVADATGKRITDLPITPERVVMA